VPVAGCYGDAMLDDAERHTPPAARVAPLKVLQSSSTPADSLLVHEVYASVQGESTWAGVPCVFVRLTGCHLRCTYCDTAHAFYEGTVRSIDDVLAAVAAFNIPLVELTGGEPLLQPAAATTITRLLDAGHTVLVETSGAVGLAGLDPRVRLIVDVKTPGSGEHTRHRFADLALLKPGLDEVKFVIVDDADYAWAADIVRRGVIPAGVTVLFSPAATTTTPPGWPTTLAERVVADRLPVRFQVQLHKVLWGNKSGV
jgi:7-carboxy-7-deazaguanine synthase